MRLQRVARSIVPRANSRGLDSVEADNNTNDDENIAARGRHANDQHAAASDESSDSAAATRHRRGGRRVVRGAGAAGASLALKVEGPTPTPVFEEPVLSRADSSAHRDAEASATHAAAPTARKGRSSRASGEESERTRTRSGQGRTRRTADTREGHETASAGARQSSDDRAEDLVKELPQGHRVRHSPKPMTSLLFQEPVLPLSGEEHGDEETGHEGRESDDAERRDLSGGDVEERTQSRSRSRRTRTRETPAEDEELRGRRTGGSSRHADDEGESRSHRSRRLNAQERRAAAEVEHIEEDLELDDISYAPIHDDDRDEETPLHSRRRRRTRDGHEDNSRGERESGGRTTRSRRGNDEDADDEEISVTRRRRRRRGARDADEQGEQPTARRSRKQQYIDEITDVEGSTRLEAKKQRRRDNRRERSRQSQIMEQDFLARREHVDRLMVVRERERHTQISVIEDNVLVEHYVSDIQEVATVGNVYLGRVQNVLPSMEAAFVDIGQSRNGVLYAGEVNWDSTRLEGQPRRIELAFRSGDPVLVQVTKDPIGHKGARLTSQVTLAGRFLVLVPSGGMTGVSRKLSEHERNRLKSIVSKIAPKDMGVIIRTAADGASEDAIVKDLESLTRQWDKIMHKREEFLHGKRPKLLQGEPDVAIRVVRDIFNDDFSKMIVEGDKVYHRIEEYLDTMAPDLRDKLERWDPAEHEGRDVFDKWQIDSQLRKGMERQVYLPSGGSIVIDRTEAMTTIDVNTGRFIGRGKSLEETVTRCNLEASEEIARQLRLRDIGGMVMIDYVDMVMPANRDLVLRRLVECLARDRTKHQVAEVTSLGLVQMTRKRIGQGLVEAFSEECPTCKGRGFIVHDEPTISSDYSDPYALKGGDPFVKTNKHGHGTVEVQAPQGSSPDVKAKLAQIAAAAVAANDGEDGDGDDGDGDRGSSN
ncbi:MAG: Rne/Rng family ribonuclease [Bifidobacterium sp.]|jgi:ribonuclease E|nr:Rne/Rng family ribonuclease [Bifidobacterium sp.]